MVEAKILIADDSKMNQQILSEILGGRYEYLYADDGMQALELLLDINMPRLDGTRLCTSSSSSSAQFPPSTSCGISPIPSTV